jgi:hypothetical protein
MLVVCFWRVPCPFLDYVPSRILEEKETKGEESWREGKFLDRKVEKKRNLSSFTWPPQGSLERGFEMF